MSGPRYKSKLACQNGFGLLHVSLGLEGKTELPKSTRTPSYPSVAKYCHPHLCTRRGAFVPSPLGKGAEVSVVYSDCVDSPAVYPSGSMPVFLSIQVHYRLLSVR